MTKVDHTRRLERAFRLHQDGKLAKAGSIYRAILKEQPTHPGALHSLGVLEAANGNFVEARSLMARSLQALPGNTQFMENYAALLVQAGDCEAALAICQNGLASSPANASLRYISAVALLRLNRLQESVEQFDRVLLQQPNNVIALNERGSALAQMKRFDDALASFARAISLNPRYAEAHFNEALCRLLCGDLARGWEKYEWRWEIGEARAEKRNFLQPRWTGKEDLAGKTILLYAEQGFGDTIQFCRYAPLVAARGAHVVLEVQKPLRGLMGTLLEGATIIARGDPLPNFDFHCPLLSLPMAFGTTLDNLPSKPSYLSSSPTRTIDREAGRLRIGLVWSASATNKNTRNKSIGLKPLLPLLKLDAEFVSLQKEVRAEDAEILRTQSALLHFGHELTDFSVTAEKLSHLDLLISVDTSVAHLAGAMGKPVWVLLPFVPDWRWLLDRETSVWYPSARLFRQDESRTWDGVIARVQTALQESIVDNDRRGARP